MKQKNKILELINKIEDVLFPHYVCPFCKIETKDGKVCGDCQKLKIESSYCERCGAHVSDDAQICMQCKEYERIFDKNFSAYVYKNSVSSAVQRLKFNQEKYLAKDFAKILKEKVDECNIMADFITFVPSTSKRIKQRGYNQSEEIAKELSEVANIPCLSVLAKIKETAHQTHLNRKERLENLIGSIVVTNKWQVKGKVVLVVDDVFTTGSTISACARALKKAGATKVYGITVAKTQLNE